MILIPQIYIRDGRVVIREGQTSPILKDNPLDSAKAIKNAGAEAMLIIDLSLPAVGVSPHLQVIKQIHDEFGLAVYVGGTFRSTHAVESFLNAGIEMTVLGTVAYQQPALLEDVCRHFPGRVAVHIDIKGGHVTIPGYTVVANKTAYDYAGRFIEDGVRYFFYSDVNAQGKIREENLKNLYDFCTNIKARVICTSEVTGLPDIERIAALEAPRLDGLVLTRALYEGRVDLRGAIAMVNDLSISKSDEPTLTEI